MLILLIAVLDYILRKSNKNISLIHRHKSHSTRFVQKHENEFQDFSRIIPRLFSVFKDSISLAFRQFLIVFAGNGDSEIGHTSFLSPEYFHYGIDKYLDYR